MSSAGNAVRGRRVEFLGCPIDALTLEETLAAVEAVVRERRPVQHCVVNASKTVLMSRDARLRRIVAGCGLVNADGQAVVWASRVLGGPLPSRVAGIDLFHALLGFAERRGYSVYFLGARSAVVGAVLARVSREHPRLRVAGHHHGYFFDRPEDGEEVVAGVCAAAPDLLFVGISSPRKEYWLAEHLEELGVPFCMGVGGSFDVYAGLTRRAPGWMQRAGLEWLYRFAQEPARMWRRYVLGNAEFVRLVAREWWRMWAGRRSVE